MRTAELAIVGGGPAALAAAAEAIDAGLQSVIIIDENRALGGPFYRQIPSEFELADATARRSSLARIIRSLQGHQGVHGLAVPS